ncbi:MAG: hypothetical protein AAGN82_15295 [Myxococcota bacterium]
MTTPGGWRRTLRRVASHAAVAGLLGVGLVTAACSGDGSPLARRPDGGAGGTMAEGGGGGADAVTSSTTGQGGSGGVVEPPGPTRITVVHGVVDADAVRFCFRPFPAIASGLQPWPGPTGLSYARAGVLDPTDGSLPADGDVEVFIVAGDLAAAAGSNCDELVDTAPADVLVRSAGVIPRSALAAERSLLFVADGCVGGPGHEDETQDDICGVGYDPSFGNAGLVAGFMSRLPRPDALSLQFVHASRATSVPDVRYRVAASTVATLAFPGWTAGAIGPFPPFIGLDRMALVSPGAAQLGVFNVSNITTGVFEQSWADIFSNGALDVDDIEDGDHLVFVAVGPAASTPAASWWNGFTFTVVDGDPP